MRGFNNDISRSSLGPVLFLVPILVNVIVTYLVNNFFYPVRITLFGFLYSFFHIVSFENYLRPVFNKNIMTLPESQLVVKSSILPGAGKGLFTKVFIPKGTHIVEYKGKITTWKEVDHNAGSNGYIYYVKRTHVIDAGSDKKVLARYANDARGLTRIKGIVNNAEYKEEGLKVFIVAKKNIDAGEEILVPYGKEYWDVIRHNRKVELAEAE